MIILIPQIPFKFKRYHPVIIYPSSVLIVEIFIAFIIGHTLVNPVLSKYGIRNRTGMSPKMGRIPSPLK